MYMYLFSSWYKFILINIYFHVSHDQSSVSQSSNVIEWHMLIINTVYLDYITKFRWLVDSDSVMAVVMMHVLIELSWQIFIFNKEKNTML